ncbi:hypothetical protein BH18CHL1_BH18CHL1_03340 [soil metagenome]
MATTLALRPPFVATLEGPGRASIDVKLSQSKLDLVLAGLDVVVGR